MEDNSNYIVFQPAFRSEKQAVPLQRDWEQNISPTLQAKQTMTSWRPDNIKKNTNLRVREFYKTDDRMSRCHKFARQHCVQLG